MTTNLLDRSAKSSLETLVIKLIPLQSSGDLGMFLDGVGLGCAQMSKIIWRERN